MTTTLVNVTIDGKPVAVPKGTTVYTAAKQMGIDIPIFCYHDRMPPFGACRMCLVEVEKMPKLQASCTLEASEGMVVRTQTQNAVEGREGIIEFLLINHPLDCPICDKGGECPLQDQAMEHGPGESRFYEEKRHFKKPIPLGPVLMLDRERCIVCARCTRFGDHIAGDHALEFIDRGFRTEVGTPDGGPAQSKFIGNTISICPVGALTSQVYRFRARPWDNLSTESTCTLCPVGCSMVLDSRDGEIMRTRAKENRAVNDVWMCDKGWFGYEFTSNPDRLRHPLIRRGDALEPAGWTEALQLIASKIKEHKASGRLGAIGGSPLTTEENYLFQQLMREGVGVPHVDYRVAMTDLSPTQEGIAPGMNMSIGDCEGLSYAILLGCDITEEFPVIWLRLKQALNRGATCLFVGHFAPEVAQHLTKIALHAPGKELEAIKHHLSDLTALATNGKKGAIFVGSQYLQTPHRAAILAELSKLRSEIPNLSLNILDGRGNSVGARLAGMHPAFGPLGIPANTVGLDTHAMLKTAADSGWDFLYVAGANPARKMPLDQWRAARSKLGFLVVQDLFLTETALDADVVLPTLSFVEKRGSFINIEGRVQKLQPGKMIPDGIYADGEIFAMLAKRIQFQLSLDDQFIRDLQSGRLALPKAMSTQGGSAVRSNDEGGESLRASFAPALFDHGERMKRNTSAVQLAARPGARIHPREASKRGVGNGDTVLLTAKGKSISALAMLDPKVAEGTVVLPLGFEQVPVQEWGPVLYNGMAIEVRAL